MTIETKPMFVYAFDIDGTLADNRHREHHLRGEPLPNNVGLSKPDWDAFFAGIPDDAPIPHMCDLARVLGQHPGVHLVYVTGRPMRTHSITFEWLGKHDLPWATIYMRDDGDHRPDTVVKKELMRKIIEHYGKIDMVFDDRNSVVRMWRANGVPCAHVAEGDF